MAEQLDLSTCEGNEKNQNTPLEGFQAYGMNCECQPPERHTSVSFLSLAGELRNRVYELLLWKEEPINISDCFDQNANIAPGLFRANKTVHSEATLFFYSQNVFNVTNSTPAELLSFFEQIGNKNAGYMRHVIIAFPEFLYLEPGNITLENDSVEILRNIQSSCVTLATLETSLRTTESMEFRLDDLDNHKLAAEALNLVNTHFRVIYSIRVIILNLFETGPSDWLRGIMRSYGWTISTIESVEDGDEGRGYSDFDDDDYGYDYDSGDGDDYDIDNDSDFWRRAAD